MSAKPVRQLLEGQPPSGAVVLERRDDALAVLV
jgi:hypothetical protein